MKDSLLLERLAAVTVISTSPSLRTDRRTREADRRCRYLWQTWSPTWAVADGDFDETAAAWDNPDWLAVTIDSYTARWIEPAGNEPYREIEARLAVQPPVSVPTIVLHGDHDGASLVASSEAKEHLFTAAYERIVLPGIGHLLPREAPEAAADAILRLVETTDLAV